MTATRTESSAFASRTGAFWTLIASPAAASLAIVLIAVVLLQLVVGTGLVSSFLVPSPLQMAASFPDLVVREDLLQRTAGTAVEILAASASAILLGGLIGWWFYRSSVAWRALSGSITSLNATPLILLYPLLLVLLGRSVLTVVVLGVLGALPPVILKTREAFAAVPQVLHNVGRCFNLTAAQRFRLIHLPAAVPVMASGFRMGVFYAVTTTIGAEFLTGIGGLGALVPDLADRFEIAAMYAAIVFIVCLSAGLLSLMKRLERWLRPH